MLQPKQVFYPVIIIIVTTQASVLPSDNHCVTLCKILMTINLQTVHMSPYSYWYQAASLNRD